MKHKCLTAILTLILTLSLCCFPTGCGGMFGGDDNSDPTPKEYTIQYSDDAGIHTLTVTEGKVYSLERLPSKYGYEFMGLYDAQQGGTQYVGADGGSLSPYSDKGDKVLYPHFKPIDYTVILDYAKAPVTGDRSFTVAYGAELPELPKNLTLAHNEFTGWYTEAGGNGTRVADAYGNLPVVSVLNEKNFVLNESKRVYLYAGFELETYTVTFIFGDGLPSEEMEVPYDTPIGQVVPKTRNSEREAGLTWSRTRDGDTFSGNITEDTTLYVKEWAPVIELNGNGADVTPIVARAGATISLPTPTKPLAKFLRWEDESGKEQDFTTMPTESITLNAVWQAKIELDENGGTDVDDISKPAGESISLPTPTKEGYLFAGWYTAQKEQYTAKKMPSAGIALKAGWYKELSEDKVLIASNSEKGDSGQSKPSTGKFCWGFSFSEYFNNSKNVYVKFDIHVKLKQYTSALYTFYCDIYAKKQISTNYLLKTLTFKDVSNQYKEYTASFSLTISDDIYFCWYSNGGVNMDFTDYYYTIHYPDTTYLYL